MNTKKYFFLALATLLIGLGVYFAPRYFAFNWSKSSIYSPVSERTASFIYFKDAETLYQKLSTLSYAETLDKSTIFNQIKENLMLSNQFMSALPATFDSKNTEQLLLLNNIGSNKLGFTYVVAFDKAFTHHSFIAALKEKGYSIQDYTFQGNTIYSIQAFNADQKLSFALYNNLCIASFNSPMVEEALSACLAKHGKTQQAEFLAFAEKETPGCDLKWFIDHQNFKHLENVFFTDKLRSDKKNTWAKWSQYALTFDESQIRIDGAYMYDENQVY